MATVNFNSARNFRIVCLRVNGQVSLVRLCPTLLEATCLARQAAKQHLQRLRVNRKAIVARADRSREVYVERWTEIGWTQVKPAAGGFRFVFLDRAPRVRRDQVNNSGPKGRAFLSTATGGNGQPTAQRPHDALRTGSLMECQLLEKRTRKGGWFAKIVGQPLNGPITNWQELPSSAQPGQTITLKVCGVRRDTGFVQLAYPGAKLRPTQYGMQE